MSFSSPDLRRIVFVYANDPETILLERMSAVENTGRYEAHAVFWHRIESPLNIPWSSELGDYVERQKLGWTVNDDSQSELESLLAEVVVNPTKMKAHLTDSELVLREHRFETFQDNVIAEYDSQLN